MCYPENKRKTMGRSRTRRKSAWDTLNKMTSQNLRQNIHPVFVVLLVVCLNYLPHCGSQQSGYGNGNGLDVWQSERPKDMANIKDLDVMCGKQHMEVTITFDKPFNGIVFSKGAVDQYNCIYVTPQTGRSEYKFDILYNQCGSKPDLNGKFYENNIVIQYDKDLIEVWDEAKRLRCEWYNDYEKGVTKPPIRVSDIEVVELNFRGDNVDCWMEIQQGKGPWASPVNGIVPLGTTLTMVVGIDDKEGEFDMRVKSCDASDGGASRPIELSDGDGCVLRPKMFSKFMKMRSTDNRATVVTYAFFHAFKFPDSMAVHIRCKVEICRFGCPDHCQSPANYVAREQEVSSVLNNRNYNVNPTGNRPNNQNNLSPNPFLNAYRQTYQNQAPSTPAIRPEYVPNSSALANQQSYRPNQRQTQNASPVYQPNPRNNARVGGGVYAPPPPSLPRPLPLKSSELQSHPLSSGPSATQLGPPPPVPSQLKLQQKTLQSRVAQIPGNYEHGEGLNKDRSTGKKSGSNGIFADLVGGLKLPELPSFPSFFGGGETAKEKDPRAHHRNGGSHGEAIPVSLGVKPQFKLDPGRRPSTVPVHRTTNPHRGQQPLVYPSSFNTADRPSVQPIERLPTNFAQSNQNGGVFPYGPRSLKIDSGAPAVQRKKKRSVEVLSRSVRSAELGVTTAFEVVSEVDLDFIPNEKEERERNTIFQGRMLPDEGEIIYGVCLPATGFSALFVLFSLLTVISVLVSGFICYHRTLAKVSEENPPEPNARMLPSMSAVNNIIPATMGGQVPVVWGFGTWFSKRHGDVVRPSLY